MGHGASLRLRSGQVGIGHWALGMGHWELGVILPLPQEPPSSPTLRVRASVSQREAKATSPHLPILLCERLRQRLRSVQVSPSP